MVVAGSWLELPTQRAANVPLVRTMRHHLQHRRCVASVGLCAAGITPRGGRSVTRIRSGLPAAVVRRCLSQQPHVDASTTNDLSESKTFDFYNHPVLSGFQLTPPPRRFSELDDAVLAIMASNRVHGAFKERMLREIMQQDQVEYGEAYGVLGRMNAFNGHQMWLYRLPFELGIGATVVAGLGSIPCVFHRETAVWFCNAFVKEDIPTDPEMLDTMFKVGSWSWQWMEPLLGTFSFVLLAFQLIRSHMQKIDMKPFGNFLQSRRADLLHEAFPQYQLTPPSVKPCG